MAFERAASMDDVWSGEMVSVALGDRRVLLVNLDGQVFAFEDRCAHQASPLSTGRLEGGILTCPTHEWQFDARTGESVNPRGARLRPVPVNIEKGEVLVDVSTLPGGRR